MAIRSCDPYESVTVLDVAADGATEGCTGTKAHQMLIL
jgi:hypothetical protein